MTTGPLMKYMSLEYWTWEVLVFKNEVFTNALCIKITKLSMLATTNQYPWITDQSKCWYRISVPGQVIVSTWGQENCTCHYYHGSTIHDMLHISKTTVTLKRKQCTSSSQ